MNRETAGPDMRSDFRALEAKVRQLREEVHSLGGESRDLRRQLADVITLLGQARNQEGSPRPDRGILLPPPEPAESLTKRLLRRLRRSVTTVLRKVYRAVRHDGGDARLLALVADPAVSTLPTIGDPESEPDVFLECEEGQQKPVAALAWLFALESVDVAWSLRPHGRASIRATRRSLIPHLNGVGPNALAAAAEKTGRPIVAKDLDEATRDRTDKIGLRPVGLTNSTVWRGGPYLVALPKNMHRHELRIGVSPPEWSAGRTEGGVLVILDRPATNGIELRLKTLLDGIEPTTVLSLSPPDDLGDRRLRAFEAFGHEVLSLGATLHPTALPAALGAVAHARRPETVWAIGKAESLAEALDTLGRGRSDSRLVWEPLEIRGAALAADTVVVRTATEGERAAARWGLTEDALSILPSVYGLPSFKPDRDRAHIRRALGIPAGASLVLIAEDLAAAGRPEDGVILARLLSPDPKIHVRIVGEGPLTAATADLARLFGLDNLAVGQPEASLEDLVYAADVLCVPGSSPCLGGAARTALSLGVPIVAPERTELTESGLADLTVVEPAGEPGDVEALADAVRRCLVRAGPADPGPTRAFLVERDAGAHAELRRILAGG